jgi:hypothetical protein
MRRSNVHKLYPHRSNDRTRMRHAEELHGMHKRHQREREDQSQAHGNERASMADRHEAEIARMNDRQTGELGFGQGPAEMPPSAAQGMTPGAPGPMGAAPSFPPR